MYKYILLIFLIIFAYGCKKGVTYRLEGRTMGTSYLVKVAGVSVNKEQGKKIENQVEDGLQEVNRQMSTWLPESEISRFNDWDKTEPFRVSEDFVRVLMSAIHIYEESGGAFDITVGPLVDLWGFGSKGTRREPPTQEEIDELMNRVGTHHLKVIDDSLIMKSNPEVRLDLAAIAKGYGVDVVAGVLDSLGYENYLVEIGGEVVVSGLNGGDKWRIGIDRPLFDNVPGADLQAIIEVTDIAMATSGDYRNYFISEDSIYSHTIDPVTGRPVRNGVASVTILAPDCMLADAMATAIMVMGEEEGLRWVESKRDVETMIIMRENDTFREVFSPGFRKYLDQ